MFERLLTSFQNIFKIPELRTRVLFTLGMLIVYRVPTIRRFLWISYSAGPADHLPGA